MIQFIDLLTTDQWLRLSLIVAIAFLAVSIYQTLAMMAAARRFSRVIIPPSEGAE